MDKFTIWLKVPQNLRSLEFEQKWLVSNYGKKLWREFLFCAFIFIVHFSCPVGTGRRSNVHKTFRRRPGRLLNVLCMFNLCLVLTGWGNYLCKQFFTSKFIISFSFNSIASLIFCFDLISTKNPSTYYFFFLSQFHLTFNTVYLKIFFW